MKTTNNRLLVGLVVLFALIIALVVRYAHANRSKSTIIPDTTGRGPEISGYNFEDGTMGWVAQTYPGSEACKSVSASTEQTKEGRQALKLEMDLIAGDAHNSCGEAWSTLGGSAGPGTDLTGRTITAWVYAPKGSRSGEDNPNGFQLFVKDTNWHSEYGTLKDLPEDQWVQISLRVDSTKPENGWVDSDFNPRAVFAIGVKLAAPASTQNRFSGPVYLDDVKW